MEFQHPCGCISHRTRVHTIHQHAREHQTCGARITSNGKNIRTKKSIKLREGRRRIKENPKPKGYGSDLGVVVRVGLKSHN